MLLTSYPFLFFFLPLALIIYFLLIEKNIGLKIYFLGFTSAYFYYLDNGLLIIILVFLALLTKIQIEKSIFSNFIYLCLILSPLFIFKYSYHFFEMINISTPVLIENNFPIGLSFFTFQAIAYYFDQFRDEKKESFFDIFTFLAFFPQLLAGPIVNISTFRKGRGNLASKQNLILGAHRLSLGLIKKFLLADTLSEITSIFIYSNDNFELSIYSALIIVFSYTFQIYFDFSAYCDIAVGLGHFFGFKFPENFEQPYTASSFRDFWRKWHITLSNFFRDYVYIKLGGNRDSKLKTYRNLWVTFFCTALWHGSSINFLIWGFLHGFFMTFEKILKYNKFVSNRFITFLLVSMTWVPFFSSDIEQTLLIYKSLFNFNLINDTIMPLLVQNFDIRLAIVSIVCLITLIKNKKQFIPTFFSSILLLSFAILIVLSSSVDPFIYFKF